MKEAIKRSQSNCENSARQTDRTLTLPDEIPAGRPAAHTPCRICGTPCVNTALELGPQPICNRLLSTPDEPEDRFPLTLRFCPVCALPTIEKTIDATELRPRFDWITYREPEPHLDQMVEELIALVNLPRSARIGALSYKDTSTLDRLRLRGFNNVWQVSPTEDLSLNTDHVEMETLQARLDPACARQLFGRYGLTDALIVRHLVEHVQNIPPFMTALHTLLRPGAIAVFEIPDFARCMELLDYTPIWEEHAQYFNVSTLPLLLARFGFVPLRAVEYPYPLENSVVVFAQYDPSAKAPTRDGLLAATELARWNHFAQSFNATCALVYDALHAYKSKPGTIALFGAGHLSAKFLNFFQLHDLVDFVADNDPHKIGLYMPGSRLPILPSSELIARRTRLCLMGLSPESEAKVRRSHTAFEESGGRFASIFPANPTCFNYRCLA